MPDYGRSAYYVDMEAVRAFLREEIGIRGLNYQEIEEQTGIQSVSLGQFLHPDRQASMSLNNTVTAIKWAGGTIDRFVKRRRTIARHSDTHEQRELRKGVAFLRSMDFELEPGESPVDALMRLAASLKGASGE